MLNDDGVLHEERVDVDVERTLEAQLITRCFGFGAHLTAAAAAFVWHAKTASP